jgi:hypothetical protein
MFSQSQKNNSALELDRRHHATRGYTLVEVLIGTALALMVMLAGATLYGTGFALAAKSGAQIASAESASAALNHTCEDTREAFAFALPDDASGFTPPQSYSVSQFETTVSGNNIDTGIELEYGNPMNVSVLTSSGSTAVLTNQPTDQTTSQTLWIYRADSNGLPNASSGQYLWIYGQEFGATVNRPLSRLFDTSLAASSLANAVAFSRPLDNASPQAIIPYEVQMQIVSGYYSPTGGTQTSVNGGTQFVSECVLQRNHG